VERQISGEEFLTDESASGDEEEKEAKEKKNEQLISPFGVKSTRFLLENASVNRRLSLNGAKEAASHFSPSSQATGEAQVVRDEEGAGLHVDAA